MKKTKNYYSLFLCVETFFVLGEKLFYFYLFLMPHILHPDNNFLNYSLSLILIYVLAWAEEDPAASKSFAISAVAFISSVYFDVK